MSQLSQTPRKLRDDIRATERRLSDLKDDLDAFEALPPNQKLATVIHEVRCKQGHTKGEGQYCGWMESTWQPGRTGGRDAWLQRAQDMLRSGATFDQIVLVVDSIP